MASRPPARPASGPEHAPTPPFTAKQEALRASLRAWVETELVPHAEAWEREHWFPSELFRRMGDLGFLGLKYPEAYGGRGGGHLEDAVLAQELARCGSAGVAAGLGAHVAIATPPVWTFGTEDQRRRYLVPSIAGTKIAALGITEPDTGSDVAALRTHAREVEGGWVVNGAKAYITNGVRADYVVMAVRTRPQGGHGGISFLLVDTDQPGYAATAIDKLGWHASDTALIALDEVFVPAENLLGELHGGFRLIMANFQWERLAMALGAVAAMEECLERTLAHVLDRRSRGPGRGVSQATRHRLADLATTIEAGRALTFQALRRFLDDGDALREVTMAKLLTQRAAFDVADACLQIHGPDAVLERAVRDARLGPIGGGTDEIMRELLGRTMGL